MSALLLILLAAVSLSPLVHSAAPPYGTLTVRGNKITGSNGQNVALHGMSLFWSQWPEGSPFYNAEVVKQLKCSWNANVVRAAMAVEEGGYLTNPAKEQAKVEAVIQAAIDQGIYVIVDWHDHNAEKHPDKAVEFFAAISAKYGMNANIIYEIFNEPPLEAADAWTNVLKPYHQKVIAAIRANDKTNLIVCGTSTWAQDVDQAAANPITAYSNIAYTLHYYAASHKQYLRDKLQIAYNKNIAVFVTEYGTTEYTGDGYVDEAESKVWWNFLDSLGISYVNWALENKAESCAALVPGTLGNSQVGDDSRLTQSGKLVKAKLRSQNNGVSCSGTQTTSAPPITTTATSSGGTITSKVTIQVVEVENYPTDAQYKFVFKNTNTQSICYVRFRMTGTISDKWNMDPAINANEYTIASWGYPIAAGGQFENIGVVASGSAPVITMLEARIC